MHFEGLTAEKGTEIFSKAEDQHECRPMAGRRCILQGLWLGAGAGAVMTGEGIIGIAGCLILKGNCSDSNASRSLSLKIAFDSLPFSVEIAS